jgi:hypothetical protein
MGFKWGQALHRCVGMAEDIWGMAISLTKVAVYTYSSTGSVPVLRIQYVYRYNPRYRTG